jgi:toxin-antitoxin system PIN domain toxin
MIYLLDINVLIALCDPAHPHAEAAREFFSTTLTRHGWSTCPLVENGFLRIFGSRHYPGGPGSPRAARTILAGVLATPGHQFWPDSLTVMADATFPDHPAAEELTDHYLLALAATRGGRFATFDARIDPSLVRGGPAAYHLLGAS